MSASNFGKILDGQTVRFERMLPGTIERVWSYLTDPELLRSWLAGADVEPRVGGAVHLRFDEAKLTDFDTGGCSCGGTIKRFDPPKVLTYTWIEHDKPFESEVTFELESRGAEVLLVLTHRRAPTSELAGFSGGWHTHLDALAARLNDAEPVPFMAAYRVVAPRYQGQVAGLSGQGQSPAPTDR